MKKSVYALAILLVACQPGLNPTSPKATAPATSLKVLPETTVKSISKTPAPRRHYPGVEKRSAIGQVNVKAQQVTLTLNLYPKPESNFKTQLLDLGATNKLHATLTDSHGKTYTPVGADGNGAVNYGGGTINLTFNNVTPNPLIIAEVEARVGTTAIPQTQLATALSYSGTAAPPATSINFQTTVAARALKYLIGTNPGNPANSDRARALSLDDLNTLTAAITGVSGTAPNLTYAQNHPSLVNIALLANDLVGNEPASLVGNANTYRQNGGTLSVNVSGLQGTDKIQLQATDAASAVVSNLGNGTHTISNATPGAGINLLASAFGSPGLTYNYTINSAPFSVTENGTTNLTVTAAPTFNIGNASPTQGGPGTQVTITGNGFTGATAVRFNGVNAASFTVNNDNQITAFVPPSATDGVITVVNGGTATGPSFNVFRRLHVRASATGSNDGTSWANAYTDLQTALAAAQANEEIWIAAGTYKAHASDTSVSFAMKENVNIYGGFDGSETLLSQRDFANNIVILSGDLGDDDDYSVNPAVRNGSNTTNVVTGADNALLDGVQIHGASTAGVDNNSVSPTIRNTLLAYGRIGMRNFGNSALIENVIFYRNRVGGSGGGMINGSSATPTLRNVVFTENAATSAGGAILNTSGANITVINGVFANNTAVSASGIWNDNGTSTTLTNSLFWNASNRAQTVDNAQGNFTASTNPFVNDLDPDGPDNKWFTADDGLKPVASALIDQGVTGAQVPATDILGIATEGSRREPGAYEYEVPAFSITTFAPNHGLPGDNIVITGSGFNGASAVRFNGTNATFTVNSATQITATVPAGATDGPITVINGGSTTSNVDFDVTRIVYVDDSAVGANNGSSWANAHTQLHAALTNFEDWDQIWVAAGTYKPVDTSTSMTVPPSVSLYGGFVGNETSLGARNPAANLSLISGDMNDNDDYTVQPFANVGDNAGPLMGASYNSTIDGFTFEGSTQGTQARGRALLLFRQAFHPADLIILNNLVFKHNVGNNGGGLNVSSNTRATISNTVFDSNITRTVTAGTPFGAGLLQNSNTNISYENMTFINNGSTDSVLGGGFACFGNGIATMKNAVFANNFGNGPTVRGAALFVDGGCTLSLTNASFGNNKNLNNNTSGIFTDSGTLNMKNGLLWDTPLENFTVPGGQGNVTAGSDPFVNLVNPLGADGRAQSNDDGLRISGSPGTIINQGISGADVPATDIRGQNRSGNPEPGAYEAP